MKGKRLLILEDDWFIRTSMEQFLEFEGFTTHSVSNGQEGLRLLDSIPLPDLILTDLNMPIVDGLEFIRRKNSNPLLKKIPLIVISAARDQHELPEKVTAVISKPFDIKKLLDAITAILNQIAL